MMIVFTKLVYLIAFSLASANAKVVEYQFSLNYIKGYPDGVKTGHILGINRQFPGPTIYATVGDTVKVTVHNNIYDGQPTTMHWHGIQQRNTPFEDGPTHITQCPLKYGRKQVYEFRVEQAGTFWYHSHYASQYTEGAWGVLIVNALPELYSDLYDDEFTIALSDWYHHSAIENEHHLLSNISKGAPPFPNSMLLNGFGRFPCVNATAFNRTCDPTQQQRPVFRVVPGFVYRVRLLNTAAWTAFNFTIHGHSLRVIEVDGVDTQLSGDVQAVYIAAGQRYSFLLKVPKRAAVAGNRFLIRASFRKDFLFQRPCHNINQDPAATFPEVTAVLEYVADEIVPIQTLEQFADTDSYTVSEENEFANLKFLDDSKLAAADGLMAPDFSNKSITLTIGFDEDENNITRGFFNNFPAVLPMGKPLLAYFVANEPIPETILHFSVGHGEVVDIVINNPFAGPHPVHLHGHHFFVVGRGAGNYSGEPVNAGTFRRDTAVVKEQSWLVLRFLADNPGVWTIHCHIDWHLAMGMMAVVLEGSELAHTLTIPDEARQVCGHHGIDL